MGNDICSRVCSSKIKDNGNSVDIQKLEESKYIKYKSQHDKIILIQRFYRKFKCREKSKEIISFDVNTPTKNSPSVKGKKEETPNLKKPSNSTYKKKKSKSKKKEKKKEKNTNNETPLPKEENNKNNNNLINDLITPENNFSEETRPGNIIDNFDEIPLSPEVKKINNSLGEFLIEEKELLKYIESYPYKLRHFQLEYSNGDKYNGYFSPNWTREGFGILLYNNNNKYEGMFKNNLAEGLGRLITTNGDYYEGEFQKDRISGHGKYVCQSEIYIGYWDNGKYNGKGELILNDGCRYIGEFKQGYENGYGKISWPDTSYYEGDFINNLFDGFGVYVMRNGKIYRGQWKNGKMNGIGIFNWPDGRIYKGYFIKDKKEGFGMYIERNNAKYEGQFLKGKQYGIAKVVNDKGICQIGLYRKGEKKKWLNEKDFKDDIEKIDEEMKKIEEFILNNDFFDKTKETVEKLKTQFTDEICLNQEENNNETNNG